jgi:hypothetical protein
MEIYDNYDMDRNQDCFLTRLSWQITFDTQSEGSAEDSDGKWR